LEFSFHKFLSYTTQNWLGLIMPNQRIFILYLISALVMGWFIWVAERKEIGKPPQKFWDYVFPRHVYGHRSAWQDYFIFFANGFLFYGILAQFLLSERPFAILVRNAALSHFGTLEAPVLSGTLAMVIFTLVNILLYDFAIYYTHYLTHKIPALWAFHKVHHSAEVLTPITLFRMHPVDLFLNMLMVSIFTGVGLGLFSYLAMQEVAEKQVLGINVVLFGFYFFGYNLRHSHLWLHYPRWLSRILISPAQHQIHHSVDMKHRDKNMGLIFSFWDWLFGTLYAPDAREEITYGITRKNQNPYTTVKSMYLEPFVDSYRHLRGKPGTWRYLAGTAAGFIGVLFLYGYLSSFASAALVGPPSVYMEELTWTELRHAQRDGYSTVIIPVGGTEQGGPHIVLGKHNYIVHHTAGEIAKRVGHTVVAPVIAYVPEGDITPKKTDNMVWTGTIGVPPQVLEDTLYWAATSLKQHGFRYIFFLGDHGYNQVPQQHVAEKLMAEWKGKGITVASLNDYYGPANGQVEWLKQQGFAEKEIGVHAAMRDTSEMMALKPDGVRPYPVIVQGIPDGVQGDPSKATKYIFSNMLELKIYY
jgi:sterol desaturase/sphingolipid hydroxylase (fatty acid hydroxylase superfamily)/creatinine amidohydrolase/Fe(II)-dependent formamide hydrolase-like protein